MVCHLLGSHSLEVIRFVVVMLRIECSHPRHMKLTVWAGLSLLCRNELRDQRSESAHSCLLRSVSFYFSQSDPYFSRCFFSFRFNACLLVQIVSGIINFRAVEVPKIL